MNENMAYLKTNNIQLLVAFFVGALTNFSYQSALVAGV